MSFTRLTDTQKKRAKEQRAAARRQAKESKLLEIALVCFAHVAHLDSGITQPKLKIIDDFIGASKYLSGARVKITPSALILRNQSTIKKLLAPTSSSLTTVRSFQRKLISELFEVSNSDGSITEDEDDAIDFLAQCLKFPATSLARIRARAISKRKVKEILEQVDTKSPLHQHYETLGCIPNAPLSVVKRSYRALVREHHPDKHLSKKLSPRQLQSHIRKFHRIQEAYEEIIAHRTGAERL